MIERAVCTDPAGAFHTFETAAVDGASRLDDQPIDLPTIARFGRIAHNGRRLFLAFKDGGPPPPGQTGSTFVVTDQYQGGGVSHIRRLGQNHGTWSVWTSIDPDGACRVTWIDVQHLLRWARLSDDLAVLDEGTWDDPDGYAGLLGVDAAGQPILDSLPNRFLTVAGVRLGLPMTVGDWIVGGAPAYPAGVLAVQKSLARVHRVFTGDVQVPAILAVSGDEIRVAISSPTADRIYTQADLQPYRYQVAPFDRPKFWGVIFGSADPAPPVHGYGYAYSAGNTEVLFGDYTKLVVGDRRVLASPTSINVPADKRYGTWNVTVPEGPRPRFLYYDGKVHSGLGDVLLIQAYPDVGEPPHDFWRRLTVELDRFATRPKGCVFKFYAGNPPGAFSETDLQPYFPVYESLLRRTDVLGGLAFAWLRPDGVIGNVPDAVAHPSWLAFYNAVAEAVGPTLPTILYASDPVPSKEPEMPLTLPPVVALRDRDFINIDPNTGKLRANAPAVGPDELFESVIVNAEKRTAAFRHKASKARGLDRWFSIDSGKTMQSKSVRSVDETALIVQGRIALYYNDFQGRPQIAGAVVLCDEAGAPLPLR